VTVPAGAFDSIKIEQKMRDGEIQEIWIATDGGNLVKSKLITTEEGETVTFTQELTDLER